MNQKLQGNLESSGGLTKRVLKSRWVGCRIGITGANGSLGKALTKHLRSKGAFVIGITTHLPIKSKGISDQEPQEAS